jgi:hypothetical protein
MARRVISAMPRVMRAEVALLPSSRPVTTPAEGGGAEVVLEGFAEGGVVYREGDCRGHGGGYFLREGGAAEGADGVLWSVFEHDLGHAEEGLFLDAFAGGEKDLVGGEHGGELLHDGAEGLRGGDAEDDVGAGDGVEEFGGDDYVGGEDEAGEVAGVFAGVGELLGVVGRVGPEAETVAAAAGE